MSKIVQMTNQVLQNLLAWHTQQNIAHSNHNIQKQIIEVSTTTKVKLWIYVIIAQITREKLDSIISLITSQDAMV